MKFFFSMTHVKSKRHRFSISFRRFRSMIYLTDRLILDRGEFSNLDRLRIKKSSMRLTGWKFKKVCRWRENTTDTIHLNIYDRTWIASFTLRTDTKEKYWIWSRNFINESIVSIPLSHSRTNVVSIPIDRKEIDITLNNNSMMSCVSWIALLKFRQNVVVKKSSSTIVSNNRYFQNSDEYVF